MDPLITSLLDLLHELEGRNVPITVGGGFGLYLKRQHLQKAGVGVLFDQLPHPRSTNDIDIFLRTDVLVSLERTREVVQALLRLGYTAVENAKYLHWQREVTIADVPQQVKIDFLVGPLGDSRKELKVSKPRARPKGDIQFHAYMTEEAISIETAALTVGVAGMRSSGESAEGSVFIPRAFPYLMMKLHAFEDRRANGEEDKARQHALDLYTVVGMMTEPEYYRAKELRTIHAANEHVGQACAIVRKQFGSRTAVGVLRLQEHALFRDDFQLDDFISELRVIFPDK